MKKQSKILTRKTDNFCLFFLFFLHMNYCYMLIHFGYYPYLGNIYILNILATVFWCYLKKAEIQHLKYCEYKNSNDEDSSLDELVYKEKTNIGLKKRNKTNFIYANTSIVHVSTIKNLGESSFLSFHTICEDSGGGFDWFWSLNWENYPIE